MCGNERRAKVYGYSAAVLVFEVTAQEVESGARGTSSSDDLEVPLESEIRTAELTAVSRPDGANT